MSSKRFVAATDLGGDTFVFDTENDIRAWFGDIPEFMVAETADKMNADPEYADKYAWVTEQFDLVKGP